jgi:AcrR family transcriptional regulator
MGAPGLRERKKAQTRIRISEVATHLFITRGFKQVSVAEVAEAAEVSKMTVFNYFPRKEDLMLDRHPELIDLLTDSIRGRAEGESPLAALRQLLVGIAREGHPLSGLRDGVAPFFRTVLESPALLARAREQRDELETALTGLLAETTGTVAASWRHRLLAAWITAAYRSSYAGSMHRLLAGEQAADLLGEHIATLEAAFDALDTAAHELLPAVT